MKRIINVGLVAILLCTSFLNFAKEPQEKKPLNIILIMTDQHRVDHVSFLPGSKMKTPNIDRLAESCAFMNCVSVNPACTPARAAMLTGKYSHQIGMLAMSGDLSLQHPTYLQALQKANYWTAGVGKFHWLQGWPWQTNRGEGHNLVSLKDSIKLFGLDYAWETSGKQLAVRNYCDYAHYLDKKGLLEAYRDHTESRGPNSKDPERVTFTGEVWPFEEEHYVDNVIGKEILEAIENRPKDKPFFVFGSFCGPHKPYDPPASYLAKYKLIAEDNFISAATPMSDEVKAKLYKLRRAYKAMINVIDDQVGLILAKLEEDGLLESTVILFTSDHGEMLGDHGRMSKLQPWRQSVIVPTAIRHPHYLSKKICTSPIELTDITATILDVAGIDPQKALSKPWPAFNNRVPSKSLLPIVNGKKETIRDFAFSESAGEWQMIQTEEWKFIRYLNRTINGEPKEELYNLEQDSNELLNRIDNPAYSNIARELNEKRIRLMDATPPAQISWAPFGRSE